MESRREFFRKAGVAGGLGAAGAFTLEKEYVKPVVRLLEPGSAYAQTAALTVGEAAWTEPVMDFAAPTTPASNTLVIVVDLPGGSAPMDGSTFNAHLSLTPLSEGGSGWATMSNIAIGATVESDPLANIGVAGPGGAVQFALRWQLQMLYGSFGGFPAGNSLVVPAVLYLFLNGVLVLSVVRMVSGFANLVPVSPEPGSLLMGLRNLLLFGRNGDSASLCVNVFANAGSTVHGMTYVAQFLGLWCFLMLFSGDGMMIPNLNHYIGSHLFSGQSGSHQFRLDMPVH